MLVPVERFIGTPILSLQTGAELARTAEPVVDPRRLVIVAFRVTGNKLDTANSVLHPGDIREVSDIGIIIDSSDQLMSTDGLVRLQEILDFHFALNGVKVEDEKGRKLGAVKSYAIDPDSFFVQQIYVKPTLMRSLSTTALTVHRSQIISVTNEKIVVKAPTVKSAVPLEKVMRSSFSNPFRSPAPSQPETTDIA